MISVDIVQVIPLKHWQWNLKHNPQQKARKKMLGLPWKGALHARLTADPSVSYFDAETDLMVHVPPSHPGKLAYMLLKSLIMLNSAGYKPEKKTIKFSQDLQTYTPKVFTENEVSGIMTYIPSYLLKNSLFHLLEEEHINNPCASSITSNAYHSYFWEGGQLSKEDTKDVLTWACRICEHVIKMYYLAGEKSRPVDSRGSNCKMMPKAKLREVDGRAIPQYFAMRNSYIPAPYGIVVPHCLAFIGIIKNYMPSAT